MRRSSVLLLSSLCVLVGCATADADPGKVFPTDTGSKPSVDTAVDANEGDDASVEDAKGKPEVAADSGPCRLVINEVQTGDETSGTADFVEVHNVCPSNTSIGGHKLVYRAATGATDIVVYVFPPGTSINGNSYTVIGGTGFTGSKDGALTSGLAVGGGAVGLRSASDLLIDSVGWGSAANLLVEGSAAAAPGDTTPAKSIARRPNGVDTDDNGKDFTVGAPTPGAAN